MPVKGAGLKNGPRHNVLDRTLWKQFIEVTGNEITYTDFVNIILTSNQKIQIAVSENANGFKLPSAMGYLAVTRYKPKVGTRSIDWKKTQDSGCLVYHTNFHSYGYKPRILWLTNQLSRCRYIGIYKLVSDRAFARNVSGQVKNGKVYNEYGYDHFKSRKIKLNLDKYFK